MKKIYFVLTYTGTILSKIVHVYTGQEFCHSSLSLDEGLTEMYSFGRYWAYNPFIGGLIKEEVDSGTFKRFHNTKAAIYSLEVTDWQYKKIKKEIKRMLNSKEKYTFNTLGLAAVVFDKKLKRKNIWQNQMKQEGKKMLKKYMQKLQWL